MIPLKLTLRGFLTYRDLETIDFADKRTAVIIGDNGNGKSALFDAITFALFAEHRGGKRSRGLVNQECRELAVRFEFESGGRRYRIDRSLTLSEKKKKEPDAAATAYIYDGADWQAVKYGADDCTEWVRDVLGGMTFAICCQSILLRQGAHDRFLAATPTERQKVLNTILDFEPYRRLQAAARGRKATAREDAEKVTARMSDLVPHDAGTLQWLTGEVDAAREEAEGAQKALASAKDRLDNSQRFQELSETAGDLDRQIADKRALLDRAEEVRAAARRRADLSVALPLLRAAYEAEQAAGRADRKAATAETKLHGIDLAGRQATLEQAEEDLKTAEGTHNAARGRANELADERQDLRPKGEVLAEASRERTAAQTCTDQAEDLKDLADLEPTERAEAERLAHIKAAIPWLRQIQTAKRRCAELETAISRRTVELQREQALAPEDAAAVETAQGELDTTTARRQQLADDLAGLRAEVTNLDRQLEHRHVASAEQVCTHCGQRIEPERVAAEIQDLERRKGEASDAVSEAETELKSATAACSAANEALQDARDRQSARAAHIGDLLSEQRRDASERDQARQLVENASASGSLNEATIARVNADQAYPTDDDLRALVNDARGADAAQKRAAEARDAASRRNQLLEQAERARSRADELEAAVPAIERARVRTRWAEIDAEVADAETTCRTTEQALRDAQRNERNAREGLQTDRQAAATLETELRLSQESAVEHRARFTALIDQVQPELRLEPLTEDALAAVSAEIGSLAGLASLLDQVDAAPAEVGKLLGQRDVITRQLAAIPVDDRRDVDLAEAEWNLAGVTLSECQTRLRTNESDLTQAKAAAAKATSLEAALRAARTREEDAKLLETLLGVQHLQGKLVEEARIGITDAANRELDAISRGTLRLEMQRKVKANGEEAELELLVLDRASVREPIDAAYLSGSQRFRVAVALALGIGQYVGDAARGQRAVIIDEGFGSLDADGIDAMAEHLRDLSDRLDRVILVTHQAAMRKHFPEGWIVRREDGTSRIEPWPAAGSRVGRPEIVSALSPAA